jgi:uncharacterized protein DUF349
MSMNKKEEVNGTEQSSSVENKPQKIEGSKKMVEEKSEAEELIIESEVKVDKKEESPKGNSTTQSVENLQKEKKDLSEPIEDSANETAELSQPAEVKVEEASKEKSKKDIQDKDKDKDKSKPKEKSASDSEPDDSHDKSHHSHEDELVHEDFTKYTKSEFVELVKMLAKHEDRLYAERYLKQVTPLFEEIRKADTLEAKKAYVKENGNEEGFFYKADELSDRFDANTRLIHDRRHAFVKDREAQRQANLKKAEEALEKLRLFVDSEESNASFNKFKELQSEWKAIGDVPGQYSKTLWANYNALINRFYDQRSIYFELKELDRKKNYEAKVKICERAEELGEFENLKEAINALNDLHYDYKHLGPVPQDLQEDLWVRFKAASDKVYQKRKEFVSDLKVVLLENLKKKKELVESIKVLVEFNSDRIKEWNSKTKEVLDLQKQWESIGGLPREKSKEVNKGFWTSFKAFFHNKGDFFKKLDEERKGNYDSKLKLVEKAEALKDNTDWFKTANDFKTLQQEWKAIGPVPEKVRNEVYEKFKAACDLFFNNKRANSKDEEKSYKHNLKVKKEIILQIEEWASKADNHIEEFKAKAKEFSTIGFVPRKEIGVIKDKFSAAIEKFISSLNLDEDEKNTLRMEVELGDIIGSKNADRVLYGKEQNLRRQIQTLENDVSLWKNNLEFFAHSKNADGLRKEVNEKIQKAESRVVSLKGQLKVLRSV